jgi:hypothetical protein
MYVMTAATIYYGNRSIPMERNPNTNIPAAIESPEDLDLESIASDLNRFVFNRGGESARDRRRGSTAAKRWELEVSSLLPEAAADLEASMKADGIKLKGPINAAISVIGNGITLRYEKI